MRIVDTIITFSVYPFALLFLIWVCSCIKILIMRKMKDGWLKEQLLRERWQSQSSNSHRRITGR